MLTQQFKKWQPRTARCAYSHSLIWYVKYCCCFNGTFKIWSIGTMLLLNLKERESQVNERMYYSKQWLFWCSFGRKETWNYLRASDWLYSGTIYTEWHVQIAKVKIWLEDKNGKCYSKNISDSKGYRRCGLSCILLLWNSFNRMFPKSCAEF